MISRDQALRTLDGFAAEIPSLYDKPAQDYRGRAIGAASVLDYLRSERERFAEVAALLPDPPRPGSRLLDIGLAYGFLPALIQKHASWKCEGLELAENIPVYCSFAKARGIPIHSGGLGPEPLPLPDGSFDAILLEVFEHLRLAPLVVFRELLRLLAPGGILILTTPNAARLQNVVKILAGRNPVEAFPEDLPAKNITEHVTHVREYTLAELRSLLAKSGFTIRRALYSRCMERHRPHGLVTLFVPPWRGNLVILAGKPS